MRWPEPGQVKTRLAATVGPERAAEMYRIMVAEVFAQLPPKDVDIFACFHPAEKRAEIETWIKGLAKKRRLHFLPQVEGDLGKRLESAFATVFAQGFVKTAAIGTDCPEIEPKNFTSTWNALETRDVIVGPTRDGGYYLIGLKKPCPHLFHEIPWSTADVLDATFDRALDERLAVHILPRRRDVDTEEDWKDVRSRLDSRPPA